MLIDISQCIYILLSLGILFEQVQLLCIFELFVHSKKFHSTLPFLLALYAAHHAMLVELSPAPKRDIYAPDGTPGLSSTLDKGFPYDD